MKQSRFIAEIMVIGDGQNAGSLHHTTDFEFIKEWAVIHKIDIGAQQ
jgi:long-chain acyl-CoA synthetase